MRVPGLKKIDLLHFLAGCHKRQLNQALSVRCLSIGLLSVFFCCLLVGTIVCVALVCVCMCSVSWLFWLSCQYSAHCDCLLFCALEILLLTYLPSDWLERLPWGRLFMVRRLSPQSSGQRVFIIFGLVYCFVVVCMSCLPAVHNTFHTSMAECAVKHQSVNQRTCMCVRACVRARMCVCACMRVCVCVHMCMCAVVHSTCNVTHECVRACVCLHFIVWQVEYISATGSHWGPGAAVPSSSAAENHRRHHAAQTGSR